MPQSPPKTFQAPAAKATERRQQWRHNVLLPANLMLDEHTTSAEVVNLSIGGMLLKSPFPVNDLDPGTYCLVTVPQLGPARVGRIVHTNETSISFAFSTASIPDSDLIRIAIHAGITRQIESLIEESKAFVARVRTAVMGKGYLNRTDVATFYQNSITRLWYRTTAQGYIRACSSFAAITPTHENLIYYADEIALALQAGTLPRANTLCEKLTSVLASLVLLLSKVRMETSLNFRSTSLHPSLSSPLPEPKTDLF